jgi:hypothetical protein
MSSKDSDVQARAVRNAMIGVFSTVGCVTALVLGFWGTIAYVAYHFISKFW